ncbi:hypothetical protein BST61_g229 [Cercospora zeina]
MAKELLLGAIHDDVRIMSPAHFAEKDKADIRPSAATCDIGLTNIRFPCSTLHSPFQRAFVGPGPATSDVPVLYSSNGLKMLPGTDFIHRSRGQHHNSVRGL